MLRKLVDLITSLKLTIAFLAAAMVLVLAGTFAQVHFGIHRRCHNFNSKPVFPRRLLALLEFCAQGFFEFDSK